MVSRQGPGLHDNPRLGDSRRCDEDRFLVLHIFLAVHTAGAVNSCFSKCSEQHRYEYFRPVDISSATAFAPTAGIF